MRQHSAPTPASEACESSAEASDLLTYQGVHREYGFSLGTLYSMVNRREIPHVRIGPRFVRFRRSDIEAWLAAKTIPPSKQ